MYQQNVPTIGPQTFRGIQQVQPVDDQAEARAIGENIQLANQVAAFGQQLKRNADERVYVDSYQKSMQRLTDIENEVLNEGLGQDPTPVLSQRMDTYVNETAKTLPRTLKNRYINDFRQVITQKSVRASRAFQKQSQENAIKDLEAGIDLESQMMNDHDVSLPGSQQFIGSSIEKINSNLAELVRRGYVSPTQAKMRQKNILDAFYKEKVLSHVINNPASLNEVITGKGDIPFIDQLSEQDRAKIYLQGINLENQKLGFQRQAENKLLQEKKQAADDMLLAHATGNESSFENYISLFDTYEDRHNATNAWNNADPNRQAIQTNPAVYDSLQIQMMEGTLTRDDVMEAIQDEDLSVKDGQSLLTAFRTDASDQRTLLNSPAMRHAMKLVNAKFPSSTQQGSFTINNPENTIIQNEIRDQVYHDVLSGEISDMPGIMTRVKQLLATSTDEKNKKPSQDLFVNFSTTNSKMFANEAFKEASTMIKKRKSSVDPQDFPDAIDDVLAKVRKRYRSSLSPQELNILLATIKNQIGD